jgi:hypothetical protein
MTLRVAEGGLGLLVRGERFDRPEGEISRLAGRFAGIVQGEAP